MSVEQELEVESGMSQDALWADFILADSLEEKKKIAKEAIELHYPIAKQMVAELN